MNLGMSERVKSLVEQVRAMMRDEMDIAAADVKWLSHIQVSRRKLVKFKAAARDPNLTNNQSTDYFESDLGRRVTRFAGSPFLIGYPPSKNNIFLPFNEVGG